MRIFERPWTPGISTEEAVYSCLHSCVGELPSKSTIITVVEEKHGLIGLPLKYHAKSGSKCFYTDSL
jgi:hypothetical protein